MMMICIGSGYTFLTCTESHPHTHRITTGTSHHGISAHGGYTFTRNIHPHTLSHMHTVTLPCFSTCTEPLLHSRDITAHGIHTPHSHSNHCDISVNGNSQTPTFTVTHTLSVTSTLPSHTHFPPCTDPFSHALLPAHSCLVWCGDMKTDICRVPFLCIRIPQWCADGRSLSEQSAFPLWGNPMAVCRSVFPGFMPPPRPGSTSPLEHLLWAVKSSSHCRGAELHGENLKLILDV